MSSHAAAPTAPDPNSPMGTVSDYIAGALAAPLPAAVVEKSKHHLLDTLSAMVSGSRLKPGIMAAEFVAGLGGTPIATVVGTQNVTSPVNAAFANGMMAHADETDDSHVPSLTHPGCGVVSAALAAAELKHASGNDLLRAVALGYDFCARSTLALGPEAIRAESRSSHTFGPTFGAAAASGALLGLNAAQVRYLLSYTLQQAGGVDCWARDKEHIEKAFDFGGMGARNGLTAAMLAAAGFTGVDDIFSGEKNFFTAYASKPDPGALTRDLGTNFEIMNTNIKRWCVGTPIQAALDALLIIIERDGLTPDNLDVLKVTIHASGAKTVNDRTIPDISLQYLLSVMLIDKGLTFASAHDHDRMSDPNVLAIKKRIELTGDPSLDSNPNRQAIMSITTRDGRTLNEHVTKVRGTAGNPMERAEVELKSFDLLSPVIGDARAKALIKLVWNIENVKDVAELRPLLQA
ncbi:hypothetical protein IZ6_06550 [Terrihabitans soli]|uniref:MmgE/PrpD family protein n=1 Tax=Terrihabitans soli TaxID=708113 RepID=A0A6S6QSN0_9HYPH|nr:MmgE/PrpD family protein [Terrihabitans soli]BCJ89920.1 hypothetical protein IZ6_06550 [Terrihabitans soli]